MKRLIAGYGIAAGLLLGGAMARADDTHVMPVEEAWNTAQRLYAEGRYGDAFGEFFSAAIRDHAQAQEIVGMMYLLGPEIYGPQVRHDKVEAQFWLEQASARDRPVAGYVLCMIRRTDLRQFAVRRAAEAACARG